MCHELETAQKQHGQLNAPTVYFGGGTPSLLPIDLLAEILDTARYTYLVADDTEVTLEANPGTVTPEYLCNLNALGVNRLSLGVQSTHTNELAMLGRIHTWDQAVTAVKQARQAGFTNLNIDLIFGLPGQTQSQWRHSLEAVLALEPEHLSLYSLSVETNTPLAKALENQTLPQIDDDLAAEMYEAAEAILAEAGFFHYEISNWARMTSPSNLPTNDRSAIGKASEQISPYVCRHNLVYWRNEAWLGIGAGAHSWLNKQRWANVPDPQEYITTTLADTPVKAIAEKITIDQYTEMGETMMMGLRLAEGVTDTRFRRRFGIGLQDAFETELATLRERDLLNWDGSAAWLTPRGRLLGNHVFMQFL
jgi:oxygen-independent coproporphyrinogen-3 oxidase